jgi:hypothetical protein
VVHACMWHVFWCLSILMSDSTAKSISYLRAWEETLGLSHELFTADMIFPVTSLISPAEDASWVPSLHGSPAAVTCTMLFAFAHLVIAFILRSLLDSAARRRMWHRALFTRLGGVDGLADLLSQGSTSQPAAPLPLELGVGGGNIALNSGAAGLTRTAAVALAHMTSASDVVREGTVAVSAIDQLVAFVAATTMAGAGIGGPGAFEDGQARESVSQALSELLVCQKMPSLLLSPYSAPLFSRLLHFICNMNLHCLQQSLL